MHLKCGTVVQYFGFSEEGQCNFGMGEHFHNRLKEERVRLTPKQADFASKLGVRQSQLSEWEKGGVGLKAEHLAQLARAGIDILYVVTGRKGGDLIGERESALLKYFSAMDPAGCEALLLVAERMATRSHSSNRSE